MKKKIPPPDSIITQCTLRGERDTRLGLGMFLGLVKFMVGMTPQSFVSQQMKHASMVGHYWRNALLFGNERLNHKVPLTFAPLF